MAIRIASAFAFAVHPGDWLRTEIVEPHGLNVIEAARHLGVTRQAMSNLLNARASLSADMAIRFEKVFGVKPTRCCGCRRSTISLRPARMKARSGWSDSARRRDSPLCKEGARGGWAKRGSMPRFDLIGSYCACAHPPPSPPFPGGESRDLS
jgi:addiction module HigA family antidote